MTRLPALRLYYGLEFFLSMPTWIVISVYIVRGLHLSPLQLVLMGTAMEAAVFAFEVPAPLCFGVRASASQGRSSASSRSSA